jgi:hypothetical protein
MPMTEFAKSKLVATCFEIQFRFSQPIKNKLSAIPVIVTEKAAVASG